MGAIFHPASKGEAQWRHNPLIRASRSIRASPRIHLDGQFIPTRRPPALLRDALKRSAVPAAFNAGRGAPASSRFRASRRDRRLPMFFRRPGRRRHRAKLRPPAGGPRRPGARRETPGETGRRPSCVRSRCAPQSRPQDGCPHGQFSPCPPDAGVSAQVGLQNIFPFRSTEVSRQ